MYVDRGGCPVKGLCVSIKLKKRTVPSMDVLDIGQYLGLAAGLPICISSFLPVPKIENWLLFSFPVTYEWDLVTLHLCSDFMISKWINLFKSSSECMTGACIVIDVKIVTLTEVPITFEL